MAAPHLGIRQNRSPAVSANQNPNPNQPLSSTSETSFSSPSISTISTTDPGNPIFPSTGFTSTPLQFEPTSSSEPLSTSFHTSDLVITTTVAAATSDQGVTVVTSSPSATIIASPSHHGLSGASKIAAIVVPIVVVLILFPACLFGCLFIRRKRRQKSIFHQEMKMKNVSPTSGEPPRGLDGNSIPPIQVPQFSRPIHRRPVPSTNLTYYTGLGAAAGTATVAAEGGEQQQQHNSPQDNRQSVISTGPPPYSSPSSPALTEQNLLHHTLQGNLPIPGERTRSPFADEAGEERERARSPFEDSAANDDDVVSQLSDAGAGEGRRRHLDEESMVSALDADDLSQGMGTGMGIGTGSRTILRADDNESIVSAIEDEGENQHQHQHSTK